jgi:hypothetical protein
MLYDCFLYNGEKELLEIRLNELSNCEQVVVHVLVESQYTHTGHKKPLYFDSYKSEFQDWPIVSLSVEEFPEAKTARDREEYQRNMIKGALKLLIPSDKANIIISDVDEIPNHKSVDQFCSMNKEFASFHMKKFGYYLNRLESETWDRARIMKYSYLNGKTPEEVRNSGYDTVLHDAGWHFSWLHNRAKEKLESFSHIELNIPENIRLVHDFKNFWNDVAMTDIPVDSSFPEHLVNNIDKFKHLIHV